MGHRISLPHNTRPDTLRTAVGLLLLAAVTASGACAVPQAVCRLDYQVPPRLDDGWEVSSLSAEGIDAAAIAQLEERIQDGAYNDVHSCLIVKNGVLVYDEYFGGVRRETLHRLYSVTKSVTSALVGIAIDQGYIDSVDQPVISYFPEYVDENWDPRKNAITLQQLLSMTSGLQYDENSYPYSDPRNSHTQMTSTRDWMAWALAQPVVAKPGTRFIYSTANSHLFSGIIHRTTGLYANQFAEEHLFEPLGISDYFWMIGDGYPATGGSFGGLKLRPRDMAKLGYTYLNGGRWKGEQIVPQSWVAESFVPRIQAWGTAQYGYQWWIHQDRVSGNEIEWFAAQGYGGQFIALLPSLDIVVVLTCGNEQTPAQEEDVILAIASAALSGATDVSPLRCWLIGVSALCTGD
jgi:CubicO group peptidase (beta-lactamase class C family)